MYYCYILYSEKLDKYYVGSTQDTAERLKLHLGNHSGYTAKAKDWKLVHQEEYETRSLAYARERTIKRKKSRKYIVFIIGRGAN